MKEWEGSTHEGGLNYLVLPDVNVGFSLRNCTIRLYQTKPRKNLPLPTHRPSHTYIVKSFFLNVFLRKNQPYIPGNNKEQKEEDIE